MAWVDKSKTKTRVLAVAKMLNEGRRITSKDIIRRLDLQYDIQVDRKTIYSDILAIDRFIPIDTRPGRCGGYKKIDVMEVLYRGDL